MHVIRDPRGCDLACKAMWQSCASPRGAHVAQGGPDACQGVHADAREGHRVVSEGLVCEGPTG